MEPIGMNASFQEETRQPAASYPPVLRFVGHLFSFVLHPLFIPGYVAAFLLYVDPYAFVGFSPRLKLFRLLSVLFMTFFLPAFSIFLLRQLRFIDSIHLRTRKDRIIPYIICMTWYFWIWYVSKNLRESPEMVAFLLATFIASIVGMMANIYFKISMHGLAAGTLFVFFAWLAFNGTELSGGALSIRGYFALATLASGLMLTARFLVSDHYPKELYIGFLAGALGQLVAIAIAG